MTRPVEGLISGTGVTEETLNARPSNAETNARIRERVWFSDQRSSVTLEEAEAPPPWTVYRPADATPGTYSGASGYGVERPTEGETHHQMNEAIRSAARQILGR